MIMSAWILCTKCLIGKRVLAILLLYGPVLSAKLQLRVNTLVRQGYRRTNFM
jgi:hypothetical protein